MSMTFDDIYLAVDVSKDGSWTQLNNITNGYNDVLERRIEDLERKQEELDKKIAALSRELDI
jgi:chaperonin cofactor prefoldin